MGDFETESFDLTLLGVDIGGTFIRSAVVGLKYGPTQPNSNPPSSSQPTDKQPISNFPTDNQPTDNQPTDNQPTSSLPTNNQPTNSGAQPTAVAGFSHRLLDQAQQSRPPGASELVDAISQIADSHSQKLAIAFDAVGVGCAGFVQHDGVVQRSPNIASLKNFPLQFRLEERLGCAVRVENDAATAAWAEAKLGIGADAKNLMFLAFGTGIGGALVIDGKLRRGAHGFGAEPGHITVVANGLPCPCGRNGCWEQYASGTALGRYAQQAVSAESASSASAGSAPSSAILKLAGGNIAAIEGRHVADALEQDDPVAQAVLEQLCDWVAVGLNTVITLVDPELVVLGGGLGDIGDRFLTAVRRSYARQYQSHEVRPQLRIELATYGNNSGSVGAALLAADMLST